MVCLKVTGKRGSHGTMTVLRRAYTTISVSLKNVMNSKRKYPLNVSFTKLTLT